MKRISIWLLTAWLVGGVPARAQDAAVEERLNKLSGHVEDLLAAKAEQDKRIAVLVKEIEGLREQLGKPSGNYANADDVRKLAEAVKEIDAKRIADNERILKQIENIAKAAASGKSSSRPVKSDPPAANPSQGTASGGPSGAEKGYEHVIAPGDTLSTIVEAFRVKGVRVTVDQILKANPGLKERSLKVGQKIFVPVPQ